MGTSSAKVIESPRPQSGPEFYWFNPIESSMLKITSNSVFSHSITSFSVYAECAIGYTSENNIIIVGGVKKTGKLSKKVFYINVQSKSVNRLASIITPSKAGQVLVNDKKIYLVEDSLKLPIQVYSNGSWNSIKPAEIDLMSSACFLNGSYLFVLSSIKRNLKPSKKIWTLDLDRPDKFVYTGKQTPFKLSKPVLVKMKDCIIIAGGSNNQVQNFNFFVGNLNCDTWKTIEGPNCHISTSPGICIENTAIWVEIPKIIMLNRYSCCVCNIFESNSQINKSENNLEPKPKNQIKIEKENDWKKGLNSEITKINYVEDYEEKKISSFSFKKTEIKGKKIIEKKLDLDENIGEYEKKDTEFYIKGDDTMGKEKWTDVNLHNTPVCEDSFKSKMGN